MTMLGLFYFGAPLSFVLGAPVSGLLLNLEGALGLAGWQWMFLIEGLASSVVGVWAFFYLDNNKPAEASWLTQEEKTELTALLVTEDQGKVEHGPHNIFSSLKDGTVLRFICIYILLQMSVAVVVFYLPSQIGRLVGANSGLAFGLVVAFPWLFAVLAVATVPRWAERVGHARVFGAVSLVAAAIGMAGSGAASPYLAVASICLAVAGLWAVQPIFWQALTTYLGGIVAVAGIALVNSIGNLGGLIAPNVRTWANDAFGTPNAGLYVLSVTTLIAAALLVTLRHRVTAVVAPAGSVLQNP
jgi:MFS family permease